MNINSIGNIIDSEIDNLIETNSDQITVEHNSSVIVVKSEKNNWTVLVDGVEFVSTGYGWRKA